MIEPRELLKPIVRMAESNANRIGKVLRLDHNERTTAISEKVVRDVFASIVPEELVAYADFEPLYNKLAGAMGVKREEVLLTHGSDTAIKTVFEVYVEPEDEVITLTPSYGMFFVYCNMYGAKKVVVEYDEDFNLPVDRILDKISDQTKLVIIANPNHTGTVLSQDDICKVLEKSAKHKALVLVDEAYFHYYDQTMAGYIGQYDNLIITRTFSKAFGIAPLRVGYVLSHKNNIENLHKVKLTHEISVVSAKFAEYLLDNPETLQQSIDEVNEGKDYINKYCDELGLKMYPSVANFVFIRLPEGMDGAEVVAELKAQDIWIKGPFKGVPVDGLIRVTVGPASQMKVLMDALQKILNQSKV